MKRNSENSILSCNNCGFTPPKHALFCPKCGTKRAPQTPTPMAPPSMGRTESSLPASEPENVTRQLKATSNRTAPASEPTTTGPSDLASAAEEISSTSFFGPEIKTRITTYLEDKRATQGQGEQASQNPGFVGSHSTNPLQADTDKQAAFQADKPIKQTSQHKAAQLSEFSFSEIAKVVQEIQKGEKPPPPPANTRLNISALESSPAQTMESLPMASHSKGIERDVNSESMDGLPFFTIESDSYKEPEPAGSPEIVVKHVPSDPHLVSPPHQNEHSISSQNFQEDSPPAFSNAGGRDNKSTMVMDKESTQQWLQSLGLSIDSDEDQHIEDASATLLEAEMATDEGNYSLAIDLYLALIRAFPQEVLYQERLRELWEEQRHSDFPGLYNPNAKPLKLYAILGSVFLLLVVGWIWPGWFRSTVKPQPEANANRTKTDAANSKAKAKQLATMQINSVPSGASVWLNGQDTGLKTPAKLRKPKGDYLMELRREKYRALKLNVTLRSGQFFAAQFALAEQDVAPNQVRTIATRRRRRRSRSRRRSVAKVKIQLQTNPEGAQIYLNGRVLSKKTPASLKLRPGRYQIQLRRPGYQSHIRDLLVRPDNPQSISVPMTQKSNAASLKVISKPPGATVSWSGGSASVKTPATIQVPPGAVKVTFSLQGYKSVTKTTQIKPNQSGEIVVRLRKAGPKGMVWVSGGPFWMGNNAGMAREKPMRRVILRGFWIDRYEVTVKEYQKCVDAKACRRSSRRPGCNGGKSSKSSHPINCVNWYDAKRYCRWAGKRLPTEAQWEKAARGKTTQLYPWGHSSPSCSKSNYRGCVSGTKPVGSQKRNRSPYGLYDMSGNVWEWVRDRFDATFYTRGYNKNPYNSRYGGSYYVIRGGAWNSPSDRVHVTYRSDFYVTRRTKTIGFRCAK